MIPLSTPDLGGREREYLARCVDDNWVSSAGPFVTSFENAMAALCGVEHGVAAVNGTAALHLALIVAGVRPGDLVVVPDWSFAATANAVYHAGARPVFVDISAETWTLDPGQLADALAGPNRVAAVIAVHALGHPADMDSLLDICRGAGVPLIEDAAGAIGAAYKGRPVGGLAAAAAFSFNGNKTVTAGGGGMLVTDQVAWADRARHLSTQGRVGTDYLHDQVAYNYRMTNLNAAVGCAQLERLDEMVAAKRAITERYNADIADRDDLTAPPRADWAAPNGWLYSLRTASPSDADRLVIHLKASDIEARTFWRTLSGQAAFRDAATHSNQVSRTLSGSVVSLPSSSHLSATDQATVIAALDRWRGAALPRAA